MKTTTQPLLKHLDNPVRFLSFTTGDLIAYLTPLFIGALVDSLIIVPAVGAVAVSLLKKGVKRFPKFYGIRYLYWSLPTRRFNRILRIQLPPSHKRIWLK